MPGGCHWFGAIGVGKAMRWFAWPGAEAMVLLRKDRIDHGAAYVGQAEVSARVAIGEARVIKAEQVQDGGVEIVEMHRVFGHFDSVFVAFPVNRPRLHSSPSQRSHTSLALAMTGTM